MSSSVPFESIIRGYEYLLLPFKQSATGAREAEQTHLPSASSLLGDSYGMTSFDRMRVTQSDGLVLVVERKVYQLN